MWHDIEQNTDEWLDLRVGKLTGSAADCVMANFGKSFGEPAKRLAVAIACQKITGIRSVNDGYSNSNMDRGHDQEPVAVRLYEDKYFVDVLNGGFYDLGVLGCSPDGRVNPGGLIEVKSVLSNIHYATIKRGEPDPKYKWQKVFNLMVSANEWIDSISYCADFPKEKQLFVSRCYADNCVQEFNMLNDRIEEFFILVDKCKLKIKE